MLRARGGSSILSIKHRPSSKDYEHHHQQHQFHQFHISFQPSNPSSTRPTIPTFQASHQRPKQTPVPNKIQNDHPPFPIRFRYRRRRHRRKCRSRSSSREPQCFHPRNRSRHRQPPLSRGHSNTIQRLPCAVANTTGASRPP